MYIVYMSFPQQPRVDSDSDDFCCRIIGSFFTLKSKRQIVGVKTAVYEVPQVQMRGISWQDPGVNINGLLHGQSLPVVPLWAQSSH